MRATYLLSALALLVLVLTLAAFCASGQLYWRDSGELALSATYLDIAHPPGYPLFSQLANVSTLLPLGPLAFRANLFSAVCSLLALFVWSLTTYEFLRTRLTLEKFASLALSAVLPLLYLVAPAALRQLATCEVYSLHCLLMGILLWLVGRYCQQRDLRYLIIAGFVGGLALANHLASALCYVVPALLVLCSGAHLRPAILPALLSGLLGLSVYAYIPVRALRSPPLNTADAVTLERFAHHVSAARDRHLKASFIDSEEQKLFFSAAQNLTFLIEDAKKLRSQLGITPFLLGLLGIVLCIWIQPFWGLCLASVFAGTWLFFRSWDPDPWLPMMCALGLGTSVSLGRLLKCTSRQVRNFASVLVLMGSLLWLSSSKPLQQLQSIQIFRTPYEFAVSSLESLAPNSLMITEISWLHLRPMQLLEGVRADILLVYQPRILFPHYFEPLKIRDRQGNSIFSSASRDLPVSETRRPSYDNLARFLRWQAALAADPRAVGSSPPALILEPSQLLSKYLKGVAQLEPNGQVYLRSNQSARVWPQYAQSVLARILPQLEANPDTPLARDTADFLGAIMLSHANILSDKAEFDQAALLFSEFCARAHCQARLLSNWLALELKRVTPTRIEKIEEQLRQLVGKDFYAPLVLRRLEQARKGR
jgi:hypothetical protein